MNDFLVQLANESEIVRDYLGTKDWKNIVKVTPNSVHRFIGMKDGKPQFQARFTGNRRDLGISNIMMRFANDDVFRYLDRKYQYSNQFMYQNTWKPQLVKYATGSFTSETGGGGGNTTCDGEVSYADNPNTWANIHDQTTGSSSSNTNVTMNNWIRSSSTASSWREIRRCFMSFDTSSIPDDATVTASSLDLYITSLSDNFSQSMELVESTQAADNDITTADYDAYNTTELATARAISGLTASQLNTWTFNEAGKSFINLSGVSAFCMLTSSDLANSEPTYSANLIGGISYRAADNGSNEPTLEVTYTPPPVKSSNSALKTAISIGF